MTTLLATERIKLASTRSPWFGAVAAMGMTIGFAGLMALNANRPAEVGVDSALSGYQFGIMAVLVLAALAVTTEYRFSTIRATFLAVPNRSAALLAKTAVVAIVAALIGLVASFGSWAAAYLLMPAHDTLVVDNSGEWRTLLGLPLVFAVAAVIAVAVGILVRQSAGALSIVLLWPLLVESLVTLIPDVGVKIQNWMPFQMADHFLFGDPAWSVDDPTYIAAPLGQWASLAYFAGVAVVLLAGALVVARRRDA